MDHKIPVGDTVSRAWTEVAQGSRLANHMLQAMPDPTPSSNFAKVNALYPHEKASDWHRAYLSAALEHLVVWADIAAPLKFHPEHEVTFSFRRHTLLEPSSSSRAGVRPYLRQCRTSHPHPRIRH